MERKERVEPVRTEARTMAQEEEQEERTNHLSSISRSPAIPGRDTSGSLPLLFALDSLLKYDESEERSARAIARR